MAKRFSDTEIWNKEWFLNLSLKHKMLVKFLFDNCDCAGVYEPNYALLSFYIGEKITPKDFENLKQIKRLKNGNFLIEDFLKFQYGISSYDSLNPKFSVHKGIIKSLEKNQLLDKGCLRIKQPLQDMDKDMDKDKDINSNNIPNKKDIETYCKLVAKKINVDEFINWYSASNWKDKEGLPINWQQKVLSWAKREPLKEVDGWSL